MSRCRRQFWAVLALAVLMVWSGPANAQPDAAMAGYVYIEPFEVRVEFVARPGAVGVANMAGDDGFDQEERTAATAAVRERLTGAFAVQADGVPLVFTPERFEFVRFDPLTGAAVDGRDLVPVGDAWLAGVFVCEREGLPGAVTIELMLFDDARVSMHEGVPGGVPEVIPVAVQVLTPTWSESEALIFSKKDATQTWAVPDTVRDGGLVSVAGVGGASWVGPVGVAAGLLAVGVGVLIVGLRRASKRGGFLLVGGSAVVLGLGVLGTSATRGFATPVDEAEARGVIEALLNNTYHAFAYREESRVFDTLAQSVDGPLLERLYLDIQRSVGESEGGGPRVRVLDVEVRECEVLAATSERLEARVEWVSTGSVSHWGHTHPEAEPLPG